MTLASGANFQTGVLLAQIGGVNTGIGPALFVSKYTARNKILARKDKLMR